MKLRTLYEYLSAHKKALKFYGDPKGKVEAEEEDTSFLVGGKKDRKQFLDKTTDKGEGLNSK